MHHDESSEFDSTDNARLAHANDLWTVPKKRFDVDEKYRPRKNRKPYTKKRGPADRTFVVKMGHIFISWHCHCTSKVSCEYCLSWYRHCTSRIIITRIMTVRMLQRSLLLQPQQCSIEFAFISLTFHRKLSRVNYGDFFFSRIRLA